MLRRPLLIAHRGASHDAPENTLPAIQESWAQQADGVEFDVRLTQDGQVVCIHDADTARVAGEHHVVAHSTYASLRALDVGQWKSSSYEGTRIPLCEEALAQIPAGKLALIEAKAGKEIVEPLAKVIERSHLHAAQVVVIGFDEQMIRACNARLPAVRTHWLTRYEKTHDGCRPSPAEVVRGWQRSCADGIGSQAMPEHFDSRFVAALRDAGCDEFHVWTVDELAVAQFYGDLGATAITTNRPAWLRQQLAQQSAE